MEIVAEALEVRLGRRGDPLDKAVTFRDLDQIGTGLSVRVSGRNPFISSRLPGGSNDGPAVFFPAPEDFAAENQPGGVALSWSLPKEHRYYLFTEVYRSDTPNWDDREFLSIAYGTEYFDAFDDYPTLEYYYWIRFVSTTSKHYGAFSSAVSGGGVEVLAPTGLSVRLERGGAFVRWDPPSEYAAFLETQVFRGTSSSFSDAERLVTTDTETHFDPFWSEDFGSSPPSRFYYWVRFVTRGGYSGEPSTSVYVGLAPDSPSGFTAEAQYGGTSLSWDRPSNFRAVDYVEIYRGTSLSFGSATLIGTTYGTAFFDGFSSDEFDEEPPESFWYWIRFVSGLGLKGGYVRVQADRLRLSADLIAELSGQIDESWLSEELSDEIGKIATLETTVEDLGGVDLAALEDDLGSLQTDFSSLSSSLNTLEGDVQDNALAVSGLESTVSSHGDDISANAQAITGVQSDLDSLDDTVSAQATALSSLESTVSSHGDDISANAQAITGVQSDLDSLDDTVSAQGTALSSLESTVSSHGDDISANAQAITGVQSELDSLGDTVSGQASAISGLESDVSSQGEDIVANAQSLEDLNAVLYSALDDLIVDGAFRQDDTHWDIRSDEWSISVVDGKKAATKASTTTSWPLRSYPRPVSPGSEYEISFYARAESADSGVRSKLYFHDDEDFGFSDTSDVFIDVVSDEWTFIVAGRVVVPEGLPYASLWIGQASSTNGSVISITDISVRRINSTARAVDSLEAEVIDAEGIVQSTASAVTNLESRLDSGDIATAIDTLNTEVLSSEGIVQSTASAVTGLESRLDSGDIATAIQTFETDIETIDGEVTNISSLYTVEVGANGLVGGFGIYNDGTSIEAGFDVDRLWVGESDTNKVKPFIVDDGVVYIDDARIREAAIDEAKLGVAAVTTLKIQGNAVIIPISASLPAVRHGDDSFQSVLDMSITLDEPGLILFTFSARQGYQDPQLVDFHIELNGSVIYSGESEIQQDYPTLSYSESMLAGTHTFEVLWKAPSSVELSFVSGTILGVKR